MMKKVLWLTAIGFCLTIMPAMSGLAPASAQAQKTIELSFSHTIPPVVPLAKAYMNWAQKVEELSKGRVKINIFWGESLLKAAEFYRGVQTGQADMTYYVIGLDWGLMPLNMFATLGFMGYPSRSAGTEIYHKIWNEFPEVRGEFKGVKVFASRMQPGNQLSFTKKQVRVPDDIKGMKIIALGGTFAAEMASMGAAPIDVKVGDMYMALERGMAEGISALMPVLDGFGIMKLLPYHTMFEGGATQSIDMVLMNQKTWNKLPPDIQKIFEDLDPYLGQQLRQSDGMALDRAIASAKEMNHTFITPTPEEMKLWIDAVQPIHQKWINETEAKGLPARAVYDETKRLIKEYKK
jgi:TRAP-type transport system periplasmic protein